jgi:hypothetical protein
MPACPQCNKPLRELSRRCPSCQADLDLLVDYVSHLSGGIQRADDLVRAGELGEGVWAYLEVLETEPDNAAARKQIGRVVAAIRRFDLSTPARRVAIGLPPHEPQGFWQSLPSNSTLLGGLAIFFAGMILGLLIGTVMPRGEVKAIDPKDALPIPGLNQDKTLQ